MWQLYRKTIIPAQLFILAASLTLYFLAGRQLFPALFIFAIMQLGSLASAALGARLKIKPNSLDDDLPLNRRR